MNTDKTPPNAGKPVSIYDVARRAGVSTMTVSRALNAPDKVSALLRQRVLEAIDELGYIPNTSAKALASARSQTIGVIIPSLSNNVFTEVLDGIYAGLADTGLSVQIANTHYDDAAEESLTRLFVRQHPAGMIVAGIDQNARTKALLRSAGCPVVQIMDYTPKPIDMCVGFLHQEAAYDATCHLIDKGYRHPGFLAARMDRRTRKRLQGFQRAIAERLPGMSQSLAATTTDPSSVSTGGRLLRKLLDEHPEVDAVFCNNDDIALGALFEAQRMNLAVPQQLGIVGFNDLEITRASNPALTTVETPRRRMGLDSVSMIVKSLRGDPPGEKHVKLPYVLHVRGSTDANSR